MVEKTLTAIQAAFPQAEAQAASYGQRGYHITIGATKQNLTRIVRFFDDRSFYIEDMCCIDWKDHLEVVYFFNNHDYLCRCKVAVRTDPADAVIPTISHIYTGAAWYEREIHEFFGVLFENNPNMSYLFLHDGVDFYPLRKEKLMVPEEDRKRLNAFTVTEEDDSFFVNMGPQHPSTHGVLRVVLKMDGEYVEKAEPVLGYGHRMQEKMGETRGYLQFLPNTARLDYLGVMSFNLGYCTAVERLCGIEVPERARWVGVITTEMNRIASHLLWIGAYLADLGALTPFLYVFDDREAINDVLEPITGSRLTYNYFRFGGLYNDVDDAFVEGARAFVKRMRGRFPMYDSLITGNVIFVNRTRDLGIITREMARKYGISGPVLRSTGIAYDMRKVEPYSGYDSLNFPVPVGERGDCLDRYVLHIKDMEVSLTIIEQALERLGEGPYRTEKVPRKLKPPKGDLFHTVETPRGELGVYIVSDESNIPYRLHLRVPSFSNVIIFPELGRGTLIADAVAILGSFDLVIPEIDR